MTQSYSNYQRSAALLAEINEEMCAGQMIGEHLDRAMRLATLYVGMAQVDATREQTEVIKTAANKRATLHPAGSRRAVPVPASVRSIFGGGAG